MEFQPERNISLEARYIAEEYKIQRMLYIIRFLSITRIRPGNIMQNNCYN